MYIGHSNNIERRIKEHNTGKTKSTKANLSLKIVHTEKSWVNYCGIKWQFIS